MEQQPVEENLMKIVRAAIVRDETAWTVQGSILDVGRVFFSTVRNAVEKFKKLPSNPHQTRFPLPEKYQVMRAHIILVEIACTGRPTGRVGITF